jgi:sarcosine oxidase subunit alpha
MPDTVVIKINGTPVRVAPGIILAAALAKSGAGRFRRSVLGEERGPLCGMGICFECRVSINGRRHQRSCLALCEDGMEVQTDA